MMYPATATPFDMLAPFHTTVTVVPDARAVGALPAGIVVAAPAALPIPEFDQAASAGAASGASSASVA
jgi:hypothetical protein